MKEKVPALDGVRGVALSLVVIYHVRAFGHVEAKSTLELAFSRIVQEAWVGVDLFFVLSGFLITNILLRAKGTEHYYRNFIMRRVLRIFPLYYLFVALFFVVLPRVFPWHLELAKLPGLQAWYWFYVPNVRIFLHGDWDALYAEHCWSLAIEEQFYLVWPLVVALLSRRALVWVSALGTIFSLVFRIVLAINGAGWAKLIVLTPAHLDGVMIGSILAAYEPMLTKVPERGRRILLAVGGIGLALLIASRLLPVPYLMKLFALSITGWSVTFAAFVGLVAMASETSWLGRVMSLRPLRWIGTYSYGLYLLHEPIFRELGARLPTVNGPAWRQWLLIAGLGIPASAALAWLVFHGYEKQFLALKRYFPTGKRTRNPD